MPPFVCPQLLFLPRSPTVGNTPALSWLCPPQLLVHLQPAGWQAVRAPRVLGSVGAVLHSVNLTAWATLFSITNPKYSSLWATVKTIPRRPNTRGNRSVQVSACTYWSCICGFTLVFLPSSPSCNKFVIKLSLMLQISSMSRKTLKFSKCFDVKELFSTTLLTGHTLSSCLLFRIRFASSHSK